MGTTNGKVPGRVKYTFAFGALGKDLIYGMMATFAMIYFTDVLKVSPGFVGIVFFVAKLWDAFNDLFMGMIVDNTRSRFGKFVPWLVIGTLVNSVVFVVLFTDFKLTGTSLCIFVAVIYVLWGMTYTIMDIPYWSMIPALTSSKEEREQVAVIPRIFASTAWLIMGTFGLSIVKKLGNGNVVKGYSSFAVVIAVTFIISAIITCLNVKERVETPKNAEKVSFKQTLNIIRKNDQLVVFIGIVLFMNLIMQIIGGVSLYYFKYVIGNDKLNQVFYAFSGLAEIGGLMLFPILTKKIGRQDVFKVGSVLPILGCSMLLVFGIIAPKNAAFIAVSGIVLKLGTGMLLGATTVMLADVVDYGQFKLGTRNESIVFSVQTLLVKTASAVSGWLVGVGLSVVGYVPNATQGASTIFGLRVLMIGLPMLCAILMYVIYKQKYKINGKFHDMILNELKNKKDKEAVI